jgi:hypothetical protein
VAGVGTHTPCCVGYKARNPSEACTDLYFPAAATKTLLMVSKTKSKEETCPLSGRYSVSNLSNLSVLSPCSSPTSVTLEAGCGTTSLEVKSQCEESGKQVTQFSCHSHWREGATSKVLLSKKDSSETFCLSYSDTAGSVSSYTCHHSTPHFTMSETGPCLQALSALSGADKLNVLYLTTVLNLI